MTNVRDATTRPPLPVLAAQVLGRRFSTTFRIDQPIAIGTPPREHRFDLVSTNHAYVGACRDLTANEEVRSPGAKIGLITEAVFFLGFLPDLTIKFVVVSRDAYIVRSETLGEYYFRLYRHLLRDVVLFEIDVNTGAVRQLATPATGR